MNNQDELLLDPRTKYKLLHREKGLCDSCSRPVIPGRRQCQLHLISNTERKRKWRKKQNELGL